MGDRGTQQGLPGGWKRNVKPGSPENGDLYGHTDMRSGFKVPVGDTGDQQWEKAQGQHSYLLLLLGRGWWCLTVGSREQWMVSMEDRLTMCLELDRLATA